MCSDGSKTIQGTKWRPQPWAGRCGLTWGLLLPSASPGITDWSEHEAQFQRRGEESQWKQKSWQQLSSSCDDHVVHLLWAVLFTPVCWWTAGLQRQTWVNSHHTVKSRGVQSSTRTSLGSINQLVFPLLWHKCSRRWGRGFLANQCCLLPLQLPTWCL